MGSPAVKRLIIAIIVICAMIGAALYLTRPNVLWANTYKLPDGRQVAVSVNCPRHGGVYLDLTERRSWFEMWHSQSRRIAETAKSDEINVAENPDRVTLTVTVGPTRYEVNLATFDAYLTPHD